MSPFFPDADDPGYDVHPDDEPARDLLDFLDEDEPEYDWLVPGLLERGDRLILTGPEGGGKSTLLRQLADQLGAGIDPFTLDKIDPVRVLVVDLENSRRHVRRELRPLRIQAGDRLERGQVRIVIEPAGIDLFGHAPDVTWLGDRIDAAKAELVLIGPLYKLATGAPTSEEVARKVTAALDRLPADHGFALIMEAHSPHAAQGGRRPERPYGASLWMRWPEFGLYLDKNGQLSHWRGARDERDWPEALRRGGPWPWSPETDPREALWKRIRAYVDHNGRTASVRTLALALGRGKSTVQRAIEAHESEWQDLRASLGSVDE
jgi:hypothetical protein